MHEETRRATAIAWGIGLLMVVLAAILSLTGVWQWVWLIPTALGGLALVMWGHFPKIFTPRRLSCGLAGIGLVSGIFFFGRWVERKTSEKHAASSPPIAHATTASQQQPIPSIDAGTKERAKVEPARKGRKPPLPSTKHGDINTVGAINAGPCGVVQVGGTGNTAAGGNCGPPKPNMTWHRGSLGTGWPPGTIAINVRVDRTSDMPGFLAECNHPCKTGTIAFYGFGAGTQFARVPLAGSRVAVVLLQSMPAGQGIDWIIQPADDQESLDITSVSMMSEDDIERIRTTIK